MHFEKACQSGRKALIVDFTLLHFYQESDGGSGCFCFPISKVPETEFASLLPPLDAGPSVLLCFLPRPVLFLPFPITFFLQESNAL